jgi:uncharacterized membrane protein YedE/YeeE
MKRLIAFASGLLFAIGLGIAGMTLPAKVINFLDFAGSWDPSLIFVMGGAVLVHLPFVQWWQRRPAPGPAFPGKRGIDPTLLLGAALFGVGWGLSGLCPGPAFVALARGGREIAVFLLALFVGSGVARRIGAAAEDSRAAH